MGGGVGQGVLDVAVPEVVLNEAGIPEQAGHRRRKGTGKGRDLLVAGPVRHEQSEAVAVLDANYTAVQVGGGNGEASQRQQQRQGELHQGLHDVPPQWKAPRGAGLDDGVDPFLIRARGWPSRQL